jgi:hypothetical protein
MDMTDDDLRASRSRHHPMRVMSADRPGWTMGGPTRRRRSMSAQTEPRRSKQPVSGWSTGGLVFAATMMTLAGTFQVLAGLVALFNDEFFVVTRNYTFDLDVTAWGWIHLILGLAVLTTGLALYGRRTWAGVAAIMFAMLSALSNFFFIPYYPVWALVVIGLDVWVIWALTRPGAIET